MAEIDHIVIGAATLRQGADWVERHLGARPSGGGVHEGAGTHNLLLGLGSGCYLEVIAPIQGSLSRSTPGCSTSMIRRSGPSWRRSPG